MKSVPEQIANRLAECHVRIQELQAEAEQLNQALDLIARLGFEIPSSGISEARPKPVAVKPPPAAREAKPVHAEKPPREPKKMGRTVDPHVRPCGHPRTPENSYGSKQACKLCALEYQKKAWAKKAALRKGLSAPAVVDDPKPVPAARQKIIADFKAAAEPKPAPHAEAAANWKGQCPMLDSSTGKRCSLQVHGRDVSHSASGRTFSNAAAINLVAMGGTVRRELDEHAMRGAP